MIKTYGMNDTTLTKSRPCSHSDTSPQWIGPNSTATLPALVSQGKRCFYAFNLLSQWHWLSLSPSFIIWKLDVGSALLDMGGYESWILWSSSNGFRNSKDHKNTQITVGIFNSIKETQTQSRVDQVPFKLV